MLSRPGNMVSTQVGQTCPLGPFRRAFGGFRHCAYRMDGSVVTRALVVPSIRASPTLYELEHRSHACSDRRVACPLCPPCDTHAHGGALLTLITLCTTFYSRTGARRPSLRANWSAICPSHGEPSVAPRPRPVARHHGCRRRLLTHDPHAACLCLCPPLPLVRCSPTCAGARRRPPSRPRLRPPPRARAMLGPPARVAGPQEPQAAWRAADLLRRRRAGATRSRSCGP